MDDCNLAKTGTDLMPLISIGFILCVFGAIAILTGRHRKSMSAATIGITAALIAGCLTLTSVSPVQASGGIDCVEKGQNHQPPHDTVPPDADRNDGDVQTDPVVHQEEPPQTNPEPEPNTPEPAPSNPEPSPSTPTPTPSDPAPSPSTPAPAPTTFADADKDGLPDRVEARIGSDPNKTDTDGDGLNDLAEALAFTDPQKTDTDGNGTPDRLEDPDGDDLTNEQEAKLGTHPYNLDTDGDLLWDGDEIKAKTDPLNPDTDGDGTADGRETILGADPLSPTPKDGFRTTLSDSKLQAKVTLKGTADSLVQARLESPNQALVGGIAGAIPGGVEVVAPEGAKSGNISFEVDLSGIDPATKLQVVHVDPKTGIVDIPAVQSIDRKTGRVTVEATSFSPFIVVEVDKFNKVWEGEIALPRKSKTGATELADAILSIDSSGSMADNDPEGLRKVAARKFVDALVPGDRVGAIDFDDVIERKLPLTTDFGSAKVFIDQVNDSGGTDLRPAVEGALDELDTSTDPKRRRIVVLLTDGEGTYDESLTQRAKDSKTTIYTVGLGENIDDELLQNIADTTGGKYYKVKSADGLPNVYGDINRDLGVADSDGDGISDIAETEGWRSLSGVVYKTDPKNRDTDGDGLTDGEEAGTPSKNAFTGTLAYPTPSDPTKRDTDGDELSDGSERDFRTTPRKADTDGDGLRDNSELQIHCDPTQRDTDNDGRSDAKEVREGDNPLLFSESVWHVASALSYGFLFGEWEFGARWAGANDQHFTSFGYLAGMVVSGLLVIGDIRDLVVNIVKLDFVGAMINILALLPAIGDASAGIAKFSKLGKYSAQAKRTEAVFQVLWHVTFKQQPTKALRAKLRSGKLFKSFDEAGKAAPKANGGKNINYKQFSGKQAVQSAIKARVAALRLQRIDDLRVGQRVVDSQGRQLSRSRGQIQYNKGGQHYIEQFNNQGEFVVSVHNEMIPWYLFIRTAAESLPVQAMTIVYDGVEFYADQP